jgi:histidine triad (HIT) family protein
VSGSLDATKVFEDDVSVAFLDHRPLFVGHTLLVPRDHYETLTDLPSDLVKPLFSTARALAGAVQEAMNAEGTFVAMNNKVSQSVPHLHVHVVPRRRKDGLRGFFWPRRKYKGPHEMKEAASAIAGALERIRSE